MWGFLLVISAENGQEPRLHGAWILAGGGNSKYNNRLVCDMLKGVLSPEKNNESRIKGLEVPEAGGSGLHGEWRCRGEISEDRTGGQAAASRVSSGSKFKDR